MRGGQARTDRHDGPSDFCARLKPYRVLLVVGSQWTDPQSRLVSGDTDFHRVVVLLKSWCVPFDILRLDEQPIERHDYLTMDGALRYGAAIWLADGDVHPRHLDVSALRNAVEEHGLGFIGIGALARYRPIQFLLGIDWLGWAPPPRPDARWDEPPPDSVYATEAAFEPALSHFPRVRPVDAEVLASCEGLPLLTRRWVDPRTCSIWIGTAARDFLGVGHERAWLRGALADAMGLALVHTWERTTLLRMEDPGAAQNAWLKRWHHATLSDEDIRQAILEPLAAHDACLTVFVVPAFVDDGARRILPTWKQQFRDSFGVLQDYASTKRGLDEGCAQRLLDIQSHGWTHMQPDLETAPGPWWGSAIDAQRANEEWYREFHDGVRGRDVPASVQLRHMRTSRAWIRQQFGVDPTALIPGGWGLSHTPDANTRVLAQRAGFGWLDGYLGRDLIVGGWGFAGTDDVPDFQPVPPDGHDRGLAREPEALQRYLEGRRAAYIDYSSYVACVHARVETLGEQQPGFRIRWHPRFGSPGREAARRWTLLLSGWLRESLRTAEFEVSVDGETRVVPSAPRVHIETGAGLGSHCISLRSPGPTRHAAQVRGGARS